MTPLQNDAKQAVALEDERALIALVSVVFADRLVARRAARQRARQSSDALFIGIDVTVPVEAHQ